MTHTVVGLFNSRSDAQAAMQELTSNGFIKEDIDLSNRSFADTGTGTADTKTGTDYDGGEGIGDRIANFFNSLFGDDEATASSYTNAASDADAILTVQVDSDERARKAQEILDRHDAMDVNEHAAQYGQRSGLTDTSMKTGDNKQTIPVVEEKFNVGKREVERGGAHIRSRVVEKPVEATVRLREEHVVVNRRPVDRAVTDADRKNFQPGEMNITERAEVPVIGKEARVVEEVEVGKNVTERDETVHDTVRRTEVDVDRTTDKTRDDNAKSKGANR
ncbi:MAG: YsnF/AvaK domain-containing protein [Acidobacteriota bacterium]